MANDRSTYVIDPEATDPDLIRSVTPLGEDPGPAPRRASTGRRRRRDFPEMAVEAPRPPRRPLLWLTGAFALGPFSLLMTIGPRRWPRWLFAPTPLVLAGCAAWIWTRDPALVGAGDRAVVVEAAAVALAGTAWLVAGAVGLVAASRRCPEGPLSRRGERRPLFAGLAGMAAPGLGLLLAGRSLRCAATIVLVGVGGVAGLSLWRATRWWAWHRADPAGLFSDLQLEQALLVLAGLVVIGGLAWLVSALEAGRLAAGPRVVRAIAGADRVPAALLLTLVAFGVWFRPLDAAHEFDRLSAEFADAELRLSSLLTAHAAAFLAPADPVLAMRVADREAALGRFAAAAGIRDRLDQRWRRFQEIERAATAWVGSDPPAIGPPPPAPWVAPTAPATPFGPARETVGSPPPAP